MAQDIPVYLFTGFMDSGKTTLVEETLFENNFGDGSKGIIIMCEDGEKEYDEAKLATINFKLVTVEEEEDFTPAKLQKIQDTYQPEQIFIEYNGTWGMDKLLEAKMPEGWVIVAAGNPPEYNRSVREFDVVTLDRLKMIDVEPDFDVWKEYAYRSGIHAVVIGYIDAHRNHFFKCETTIDGKRFVTARGWEDLSELIWAYERLGKRMSVHSAMSSSFLCYAKSSILSPEGAGFAIRS